MKNKYYEDARSLASLLERFQKKFVDNHDEEIIAHPLIWNENYFRIVVNAKSDSEDHVSVNFNTIGRIIREHVGVSYVIDGDYCGYDDDFGYECTPFCVQIDYC